MSVLLLLILLVTFAGCSNIPNHVLGPWQTESGEIVSIRESGDDTLRLRFFETGESRRFARQFADSSRW